MARRIMNRKQLREAVEAAERQAAEEELDEEEQEDEDEGEEDLEDEDKPKKKVRKKAATTTTPKSKKRTVKAGRVKIVWGVYSSNQTLEKTFEYPQKAEAEKYAAKLSAEKKSSYYVNPVRVPLP